MFPSDSGSVTKPLRKDFGLLLVQQQLHFLGEEILEEIRENPYFQYFIGLMGYVDEIPLSPLPLVGFCKRLSEAVMIETNEMILEYNLPKGYADDDDDDSNSFGDDSSSEID